MNNDKEQVAIAGGVGLTAAQFEEIAQGWDGCRYEEAMIDDIAAALRADYKRLVAVGSAFPAATVLTDERIDQISRPFAGLGGALLPPVWRRRAGAARL